MSAEPDGNLVHIDPTDVDFSLQGNVKFSEKSCDSGIESTDSCSVTILTSPESKISPDIHTENEVSLDLKDDTETVYDLGSSPILSSPTSISPDVDEPIEDLLNLDEFAAHKNDFIPSDIEHINTKDERKLSESADENNVCNKVATDIMNTEFNYNMQNHDPDLAGNEITPEEVPDLGDNNIKLNNITTTYVTSETSLDVPEKVDKVLPNIKESNDNSMTSFNEEMKGDINEVFTIESSTDLHNDTVGLENSIHRNFTTSTTSLDEQNIIGNKKTISKTFYSKSAENISIIEPCIEHKTTDNVNLNSSSKEMNTEKILSQFSSQKNKVTAIQKLSPELLKNIPEPVQNIDQRYARLPKEILHQDLGSLVKNVHGIFSSVSGSLKYAYNQTQRVPKPSIISLPRPITNGKVMDDIFEEIIQNAEKNAAPPQNGVEKLPINTNLQHLEGKPEENSLNLEGKEVESETKKDILKLQIESLERVLAEQRKENACLRERVKQQVDEMQERDHTFKELEAKVDQMSKRVEQAEREKDAAVMRYASVECAAIEARRAADKAAAAEKAACAEMELMNNKLKSAHSEKARICQLYDDKCHELANSEKELSKVREDVKELEGRLKWTQSKLRMEIDAYKDSAERADKLSQQVAELEAAKDAAAANATDSVRARQLEQELKESQAALIMCRHEKEDLERRLASTSQLLDTCRKERDAATSALAASTAEVERLKESNLRLEEEAAELAALRAQAALADTLSAQLQRESDRASQAEESLSRERARAETCARREAAALEHAARLTAQHVQHRASCSDHEHKAQALALDNASLRERITYLEAECARLESSLSEETDRRSKETRALARKVAELTEEAADAVKKLEWEKGENRVLKKKHANAIKELNRELQRVLKRCEQLEAKLPPPDASNRTGSVSSLSSGESASVQQEERLQNGHSDHLPDIQVREPDRQALIERIVSLQRAAARRAERCEFLEEHSRQLTAELRGKAKLLRHLLSSLPAGAVADSHSDAHKKEIARLGGGAMAAVWGGDTTGMSLELSLEMNTKLQAVLEDALLKNITLKENLDTLGEEIARLKERKNSITENNPK